MADTSYRSFIVPAGKYWLLDPYHLFASKPAQWLEYFRACAKTGILLNGHYESFDDRPPILSFLTNCGPLEYTDQLGNSYSSATGLLGLVPVEYNTDYDAATTGIMLEFDAEALCFTRDGILTFGNYIIDTAKDCDTFLAYEI